MSVEYGRRRVRVYDADYESNYIDAEVLIGGLVLVMRDGDEFTGIELSRADAIAFADTLKDLAKFVE